MQTVSLNTYFVIRFSTAALPTNNLTYDLVTLVYNSNDEKIIEDVRSNKPVLCYKEFV